MSDGDAEANGWKSTTLGAIGRYINGRGFKTSEWAQAGRPIIRIQDLTGSRTNPNFFAGEVDERHVVRQGDLLISWSASLGAYIWDGPDAVLNQHIFKVESFIDKRFHFHLARACIAQLATHGSGMVHVTRPVFEATPVRIPTDRHVQQRIAALLDSLSDLGSSANRRLSLARESLARFRQSILAAACSGRLTADWRASAITANGSYDGGDFPSSWSEIDGSAAFTFITSGSRGWAKYYSPIGAKFLRVGNLDHNTWKLDLTDLQHVDPPPGAEGRRTQVKAGDILISITAEIGMVGVAPPDIGEAYVNQHVAIARPSASVVPEYVAIFLASPEGGQLQFRSLERGATKTGLGLDDIRSLRIPCPPTEEQREIVTRVERILQLTERLDRSIGDVSEALPRVEHSAMVRVFGTSGIRSDDA